MIRVMIAEDNTSLNHLCCNYLTNDKDIQIVFSAYDGEETLERIKTWCSFTRFGFAKDEWIRCNKQYLFRYRRKKQV